MFNKIKNTSKFYLLLISKLIIYKIPLKYSIRKYLFGKHGEMDDELYSNKIYNQHVANNKTKLKKLKTLLELGPGDSCMTVLFALKDHFDKVVLIDKDISSVRKSLEKIKKTFNLKYKLISNNYLEGIISYEYNLFSSKRGINLLILEHDFSNELIFKKPISFDIIFSNAVLQHLSSFQIKNFLKFSTQYANKECLISHQIRFTDHITGKNQKFEHRKIPKLIWESKFFKSYPFWTNRYTPREFIYLFNNFNQIVLKNEEQLITNDLIRYNFILKVNK